MNLEERLKIEEESGRWNEGTLRRASVMIEHELNESIRNLPYSRLFVDIEDFKLYYEIHPDWKGKTVKEILNDKERRVLNFYNALNKFLMKTVEDISQRYRIRDEFFHSENLTWKHCRTIDDWIQIYESHTEWKDRTTLEMIKDETSGANRFYAAFIRWTNKQSDNKDEKKELRRKVFPNLR